MLPGVVWSALWFAAMPRNSATRRTPSEPRTRGAALVSRVSLAPVDAAVPCSYGRTPPEVTEELSHPTLALSSVLDGSPLIPNGAGTYGDGFSLWTLFSTRWAG